MKKQLFMAALLAFGITSAAQTEVTTYTPGISAEGAVYYLPKTAINVGITVEKTIYTPGELCQYAERYMRINNIMQEADLRYFIKGVTLSAEGLPDVSKAYHIKITSNSVAPFIELNDAGVLLAVNAAPLQPEKSVATPVRSKEEKSLDARSFMTEEMLMTSSKAKLAELVAKEIYNIRENRNLILRGQNENTPQDGEGIQIILDGLQQQEDALMKLFVGTTSHQVITESYQVIPEGNTERFIIGRFSHKLGLLHRDDLAGSPIYIDIKGKGNIPAPAPVEEKKGKKIIKEKKNKEDGIVYNIPDKVSIKVYTNRETFAEESMSIAQFGTTETLSSSLFTKKKDIKVWLDPVTGALLKIEE